MTVLNRTRGRRRASRPAAAAVLIGMSLAVVLMRCSLAVAAAAAELYRAQTIVTGQGEPNRSIGFAACLEDVLIKVSGALKLAGQGSRDRPYDLIVDFDEGKIDDLLKALGLEPWRSHRPVLAVFVEMEQGVREYVVTSDAKQSDLQRDALRSAAAKRGITIVLPDAAALAKSNIDGAALTAMPAATLAGRGAELGADVALVGRLVWDDSELGWVTEWRMDWQGRAHRWQARGVTFDEAFRRGIGGAAQVLSDNGDPG